MAKSIIGLLIGIALREGKIRSIDDLAQAYVPGLQGTHTWAGAVRRRRRVCDGAVFLAKFADGKSDIYTLAHLTLGQDPGGSLTALKPLRLFAAPRRARISPIPGRTPVVLGLVLAAATGRTLSDYTSEKLWRPLGTEADATWAIDATGQEIAFAYVNAVLRDWARLGLMLAHEGAWAGRRSCPKTGFWRRSPTRAKPDRPCRNTAIRCGCPPT